jgi:FkbM family methyltransferase
MTGMRTLLSRFLFATPLAYFPVRVRQGPAKGARWTAGPFSHNWRHGGEADLAAGLALLPRMTGAVCWDFGAHFGIHTIGMAFQVGSSGQVLALEPDPVAFRRLSYHVRINRLENVVLIQAAASASTGQSEMIITNGMGSSCSHFRYEDEEIPNNTETMKVERVVPDELVDRGKIRLPDLIKVDVQGHGAHALCGSLKAIHRSRPIIVFSNHSHWEIENTRDILEPLGYRVQDLKGRTVHWEHVSIPDTVVLICSPVPPV